MGVLLKVFHDWKFGAVAEGTMVVSVDHCAAEVFTVPVEVKPNDLIVPRQSLGS